MSLNLFPLPHSDEAEKATLGAMLIDKVSLENGIDSLSREDFYDPRHALVFQAISNVHKRDGAIDLVTITEQLQQQGALEDVGVSYLGSLCEIPTVANTEHYIRIVQQKSQLRKLIDAGKRLQELGYNNPDADDAIDKAESLIFSLATSRNTKGMIKARDFIHGYCQQLEKRAQGEGGITGLPTGYEKLDKALAGLQKSDLIVIAGRPSMGKTALAINLAENVCEAGGKVCVFSLEMSKEQLLERMVCSQAKVPGEYVRTGNISEKQWGDIRSALGRIKGWDLEIDDSSHVTVSEIRSKLRKSHAEKPVDLVVIDYLGLINTDNGKGLNKADQIGQATKALKQLARELDCPIILLSQLSRAVESRDDKRPMLSDLRDSGAIEQDADVVLLLYRDEYYNHHSPKKGRAEVIIAKQRKGAVGTIEMGFIKNITRFKDTEK